MKPDGASSRYSRSSKPPKYPPKLKCGTISATVRHASLRYPVRRAHITIRRRVSALIRGEPASARDTVATDTPHCRAISCKVGFI